MTGPRDAAYMLFVLFCFLAFVGAFINLGLAGLSIGAAVVFRFIVFDIDRED